MKLRFQTKRLGAALLAAGPVLMQFVPQKAGWWAGFIFTIAAPFLMSVREIKEDTSND